MAMLPSRGTPLAVLFDAERFPFDEDDLRILASGGVQVDEIVGHDPVQAVSAAREADAIFVYSLKVDKAFIEQLNHCKIIARCGVGYDNIDVAAAQARGIEVTYVPDYGVNDVAEHTIALLMASARRLAACDRAVQAGNWPSYLELGPMSRISSSTLGLLGFGRIARQVATRASALGLSVLAHDSFIDPKEAQQLGVDLLTLEQVLERSDFVSVHLPLTPQTHHLINNSTLRLMRPSAILINTSRGAIIDQDALLKALDAGNLAGAALDVLEHEPPEEGNSIFNRPNVLITPHSAAYTREALSEVRRTALIDVIRVLHGEQPLHPIPNQSSRLS